MISIRPHVHPTDPSPRAPRLAGLRLGILVACVTWGWVAIVDITLGEPLRTASILGGLATFTVVHLLLCLTFGAALNALVAGAVDEPGLILAVVVGTVLLEGAFAMLTAFISITELGTSAWVRIFIGSLLGTGVAMTTLSRWYPIRQLFERAESAR